MAFTRPSIEDFKAWFVRDFPFADPANPDDLDSVTDMDITKAMAEASMNINEGLFTSETAQEDFSMAFLYLTAHYLVHDARAAAQGIAGKFTWATTQRTVGTVSESYFTPSKIANNPVFAFLSTTPYGAKYLSLILPLLIGNIGVVQGRTWA